MGCRFWGIVAASLLMAVNAAFADSIDLIKNGEIVVRATCLYKNSDAASIKDRLFKLTLMVNQALKGISGHALTSEGMEGLKNKIKISVLNNIDQDAYALSVERAGDAKELRIAGNNIEHTERAVFYFLSQYLHLSDGEIGDLESFTDKVLQQTRAGAGAKLSEPVFKKTADLAFSQDEAEIRSVPKNNN